MLGGGGGGAGVGGGVLVLNGRDMSTQRRVKTLIGSIH